MKKSFYLIASLAFLFSCSGTSEIYDDAYNARTAPPAVNIDENGGYADYIKNQENHYEVKVDSAKNRTVFNNNPVGGSPQYSVDNASPNYNHSQFAGDLNYCPYSCQTYFRQGHCWHSNNRNSNNGFSCNNNNQGFTYGNSGYFGAPNSWCNCHGVNGQNYNVVYGTNDPHNPYGSSYYSTGGFYGGYNAYNSGSCYGNNGFYNNGCYNNYGYNNYYYGNGNNSWYPYYGFGGWGNGFNYNGNNWGSGNNNFANNETTGGNHHFGHRGGSNTGSYSQNNTTYEHTVKQEELVTTPFPAFASANGVSAENVTAQFNDNSSLTSVNTTKPFETSGNDYGNNVQPATSSFSSNNTTVNGTAYKPSHNNTTVGNSGTSDQVSKPVTTTSGNTAVVAKGKPATNQFAGGNAQVTTTSTARNNGSSSTQTYAHPNKYGNQSSGGGSYQPANNTTYSGTQTSSSRRTSSSGTTYGGNSNSNNSNSNSSGNSSTYRTNSSGSSGSSNSGSRTNSSNSGSSGSSGSGGTTSRRN